MFKKILIANRGEIAMRIIRCCREMGIRSVLACSQEDLNAMPAQFANEIVCIGPAPAGQSYLNQNALVQAARSYGCEAIHPGYGFLSENAEFARLCEEAGVKFIGPSSRLISLMGDKQSARALMQKKGVPVVPGSDGILESAAQARKIARKIGYPVLLKASAGGGGRGMRIARNEAEVEKAFSEASAEAKAAFGDGSMYLEKLIHDPRHIEVQIIGDEYGHIVQLGERDCSMQRRNQKLLEEAPAPGLTRSQRGAIQAAALKAAKAAGYYSAGTVEFVMDQNGKNIFGDENDKYGISKEAYYFIAGMLEHAKGMMALTNPLVNSYKRLVPDYEAPIHIAWSAVHRSPLIRVPAVHGGSYRIELRSPDSAGNPYLVLACCIAAGLEGMREKKMPMPCVEKNVFAMSREEQEAAGIESLPITLQDAIRELEKDELVKKVLGPHTSEKYIQAKYDEWERYRTQITNWEIDEYLYKI